MGTGIRTANGLGASRVYYVGDKKWDKRASVGVHNYTEVQWISSIEEFKKLALSWSIVGVDNVPGSISMQDYVWPDNPLMVFGEEGTGLTPGMQALCKDIVHIDMVGSVRSFNCGAASAMAMYDFVSKFRRK
jgi:tRNA G18 (ribose-2'-O)-methylase SpoU